MESAPMFLAPCPGKSNHNPMNNKYCLDCGLVYRKRNRYTGGPIYAAPGGSLRTKYRLLIRDGNCCHYCNEQFDEIVNQPTIDHVIPKSRGGKNRIDNYVLSCFSCNQRKGDMTKYEFMRYLEALDGREGSEAEECACEAGNRIDREHIC